MSTAFLVMLSFGAGTAIVLLLAGVVSGRLLARWKPGMISSRAQTILGATLLVLGVLVLTGLDKILEALAVGFFPEWVYAF